MDYKELLNKTDAQGVKGPIFFGEKILVYERDNKTDFYPGYIDLPGGGSEENETVLEAYKREVQEEFGLEIQPENILYAKSYPSIYYPGKTSYYLVASLPEEQFKTIQFGDEGKSYRLMDVSDYLNSEKVMPHFKERLQDFLAQNATVLDTKL